MVGIPENLNKIGIDTYSHEISNAKKYMSWMLSHFIKYIGGNFLEVGLGHGSYYNLLNDKTFYTGIDIDEVSISQAKSKFPRGNFFLADITKEKFYLEISQKKFDSIICFNVLEHIEDDAKAMVNMINSINEGGYLILAVPAMQMLYNDLDRIAGHHRRYSKNELLKMLEGLSVEIIKVQYINSLGGIGWFLNKFVNHNNLNSSLINNQIRIFEKYILPFNILFDRIMKDYFGQTLICVIKKL